MFLPLTVGGGIRSIEDMRRLLLAGADKCSINSAAVARPELVRRGGARNSAASAWWWRWTPNAVGPGSWDVFTHGGRRDTGIDAIDWCRQVVALGAGEILLTSMDRDGTGDGFDLDLLRAVCGAVRVPVIASGGVGTLQHFVEGARPARPACWPPACSISARSPSPRLRQRWQRPDCRCACRAAA